MMRNFDYLQDLGLTDLHKFCSAAEELQVSNPDLSAISARKALEYMVRSLYVMKNIEIPERASLFELVDSECVIRPIPVQIPGALQGSNEV